MTSIPLARPLNSAIRPMTQPSLRPRAGTSRQSGIVANGIVSEAPSVLLSLHRGFWSMRSKPKPPAPAPRESSSRASTGKGDGAHQRLRGVSLEPVRSRRDESEPLIRPADMWAGCIRGAQEGGVEEQELVARAMQAKYLRPRLFSRCRKDQSLPSGQAFTETALSS